MKRNISADTKVAKKPRHFEDDVWGEDLDFSVLDDAIFQTTQITGGGDVVVISQQDKLNESLSYNAFKDLGHDTTSTQQFTTLPSVDEYKRQVDKLRKELEVKDGEVAVLRGRLQSTMAEMESGQARRQKEWAEKLEMKNKEIGAVRTELEFKNLEIMNLKQKVLEVSKMGSFALSQREEVERKVKQVSAEKSFRQDLVIEAFQYDFCPLFKCVDFVILKSENAETDLNNIYINAMRVTNLTTNEMQSESTQLLICDILNATLILLDRFKAYLQKLNGSSIQIATSEKETGIVRQQKTRKDGNCVEINFVITLLAVLTLYNRKLRNSFLGSDVNFSENCSKFSDALLTCLRLTRKFRDTFTTFLCSSLKYIRNLYVATHANVQNEIILEIFREIVSGEMNSKLLLEVSLLLRYSSQNVKFAENLCKNVVEDEETKVGCLIFTMGMKVRSTEIDESNEVIYYRSLLAFCYNVISSNPCWLYYKENLPCCSCCYVYSQLCIDVVYNLTRIRKRRIGDFGEIFNLAAKLIHAIHLKLFTLIEKSPLRYSRYRTVINYMLKKKNNIGLNRMNEELLSKLFLEEDEYYKIDCKKYERNALWRNC